MSEVMLLGILRLPPELWRDDPIDVAQRHARYVEAAEMIERLQGVLEALKELRRVGHNFEGWHPRFAVAIERAERAIEKIEIA